MPKYSREEFQSRLQLSRRIFYEIQDDLVDFLDYVPLDLNHMDVYSFKLLKIILQIGPELINSLDLAVAGTAYDLSNSRARKERKALWEKEGELRRKKKSLTFHDYYCFLEEYSATKLSSADIQLKDLEAYMKPFEESNPTWWESYNLLRHDKYSNLKNATLRTTLKACGALFFLVNDNNRHQSPFYESFSSDLFFRPQRLLLQALPEKL